MIRTLPPPRMYLLLAREAWVGVLFRRGPSKWVELVLWNTAEDTFERGQWFHGRIYERRCDLSPDGQLLVYFASKFNRRTLDDSDYTYAWTAVSRPPWLNALALWPKGDCWHGGGLFATNRALLLNHRPDRSEPHAKHRPAGLHIEANPHATGENDPLFSQRLARDGWAVEQEWKIEQRGWPYFFRTVVPERRRLPHPASRGEIVLERRLDGLKYRETFFVEGLGYYALPSGGVDWADWDHRGRLVFVRQGALYAFDARRGEDAKLHLDLTEDVPIPVESPRQAQEWPTA